VVVRFLPALVPRCPFRTAQLWSRVLSSHVNERDAKDIRTVDVALCQNIPFFANLPSRQREIILQVATLLPGCLVLTFLMRCV
jgi:hypothetical protein